MKISTLLLLAVLLNSALSANLIAQTEKPIKWQIGLNTVPLLSKISNATAQARFSSTPNNVLILKRINEQKSSAWRFSGELNYENYKPDLGNYFITPYQLKLGVLAGYEKRKKLRQDLVYIFGAALNPIIVVNPGSFNTIIIPSSNYQIDQKNTVLSSVNVIGFNGLEYNINDLLSLSFEGSLLFNYQNQRGGVTDITWESDVSNGFILSLTPDSRTYNFDFKPIYFLNLNINLP